jgi:hypothetical protein
MAKRHPESLAMISVSISSANRPTRNSIRYTRLLMGDFRSETPMMRFWSLLGSISSKYGMRATAYSVRRAPASRRA